jgi:hypothetical protein
MADPPLLLGAVNATVAVVNPVAVAVPIVGASGVPGVTLLDGADGVPCPPIEFSAVTTKVYAVPFVSPVTIIGELNPDIILLPGLATTMYIKIGVPPSSVGGVNEILACSLPATATTFVGSFGPLTGTTQLETSEGILEPTAFSAFTVKLYDVLVVRPVMVIVPLPAPVKVPVIPPGEDVATYLKMAEPPLFVGAVNETVAEVAPVTVADPIVGAPGTVCAFIVIGGIANRK